MNTIIKIMTLTKYFEKIAKKKGIGIMKVRRSFAEKLNKSEGALYKWETCKRFPCVGDLKELYKLLKKEGYDINVLDLF